MIITSASPGFPFDPNGPASTFAAGVQLLASTGKVRLAEVVAGANHVAMSPNGDRPDREYLLQLDLHPDEFAEAATRREEVAEAMTRVSALGWTVSIRPVNAALTELRSSLNSELEREGLPPVLDVRYRERPGGGSHNVAVHHAPADPVHVGATDDVLFRIGGRQTAWVERYPIVDQSRPLKAAGAPSAATKPLVFVSYSTADEQYRDELMRHLAMIGRDLADVFTFRQIGAGDDHHAEIKASLDRSQIGILMVSADFLASEYVAGVELPALIEGDKRLFAVVAGQCDHEHISSNLFAPWGLTPLKAMTEPDRDDVYTQVARELRRALHA